MDAHTFWKLVHVLSSTVLFGTGLGIAFFAWFGYQRALAIGEIVGLRTVLRLTVIADTCFTAPAVLAQFISGLFLMRLNGWSLTSAWAQASIGLFVVVIQIRMSREATRAAAISALGPGFHRQFKLWFVLGVPAFLIVLALFYLMIAKPLALT